MKYSVGTRFNFSVAAGVSEVIKIRVGKAGQLDGLDVSGAAFTFYYEAPTGPMRLPIEHGAELGVLNLSVPKLEPGELSYSLEFTDALGQNGVLLYGVLTVISRQNADALMNAAEAAEQRVLAVTAGSLHDGPVELRWSASSMAAVYAEDAKAAALRAEDAAGYVSGLGDDVSATLQLAMKFMESFYEALRDAIVIIDNWLYVGGKPTGHYLKGEPGITPHIGPDGYWYEGAERLGDRPAFGKDGITPHITPDGYWAFGDYKTERKAEGRDGIDGTAVRRIIVASYEDIPKSGETCNGGFLYYVPASEKRAQRMVASWREEEAKSNYTLTGPMVFNDGRTWTRRGGRLMRLGILAGSSTQGGEPSDELLFAHLYYKNGATWVYAGRSTAAAAQATNAATYWEFNELDIVPTGSDVKVVLSQVATEPTEEQIETVRIQVVPAADGSLVGTASYCACVYWEFETNEITEYDVYAWCETEHGPGWKRVDTNYDIATDLVHGLTKLSMSAVVVGGAPVGVNNEGGLSVPIAEPAVAGSVKPSSLEQSSDGGKTMVAADGKMYTCMATPSEPGVGKTSYTHIVENTATVGMTADGKYAVPRADVRQWGCCRIGTIIRQTNGAPYIIPMGRAADGLTEFPNGGGGDISGQLMMNTLYGGAIRTYGKSEWADWLPDGLDYDLIFENSNAVGLVTSMQFRQSAAVGLELVAATTDTLAGVYLAESMEDTRSASVTTPAVVMEYLNENYYGKRQVYNKTETQEYIETKLKLYMTRSDAVELFPFKREVEKELNYKAEIRMYNKGDVLSYARSMYIMPNSKRGNISSLKENDVYLLYLD